MTVVFGRLVNDFNTFDIETAEELRESVDTNVYVSQSGPETDFVN